MFYPVLLEEMKGMTTLTDRFFQNKQNNEENKKSGTRPQPPRTLFSSPLFPFYHFH